MLKLLDCEMNRDEWNHEWSDDDLWRALEPIVYHQTTMDLYTAAKIMFTGNSKVEVTKQGDSVIITPATEGIMAALKWINMNFIVERNTESVRLTLPIET